VPLHRKPRSRPRAIQLRLPFTFIRRCTQPGCPGWFAVDPFGVVGREDLCPDCRLVDLANASRAPYS
jgi:hypothetical protein